MGTYVSLQQPCIELANGIALLTESFEQRSPFYSMSLVSQQAQICGHQYHGQIFVPLQIMLWKKMLKIHCKDLFKEIACKKNNSKVAT